MPTKNEKHQKIREKPKPVQIVTSLSGPLILPKMFNPTTFPVGRDGRRIIWKGPANGDGLTGEEEQDARSLLLTEIDFTKLTKEGNFLTGLECSEAFLNYEIKRARLIAKMVQADARIAQALYEETGQKTLRFLHDTLGVTWIEFLGTTLRGSHGGRYALYLHRLPDGSWDWHCCWLDVSSSISNFALSFTP